jgi:hypothetical protein
MKMLMLVAMFSLFFYTGAGYLQTLQALSLISGNHAALLQLAAKTSQREKKNPELLSTAQLLLESK